METPMLKIIVNINVNINLSTYVKINVKINVKDEIERFPTPEINKKGWQFAFMMKLNNSELLMRKFNKIC
jgi:hypothetical protein